MTEKRRALVLTAHADDCEFFAGGHVAGLATEGWEVYEVIATDNSRGSFELNSTDLVRESRDREARAAAKIMGKTDVEFLGYPDGFLDETPKNELRRIFMERIRRRRPHLLLSFDAFAHYEPHPDHIHVARAALEAASFAHLPLYHPEQLKDGVEPWMTPESLWFAKHDAAANFTADISAHIGRKIEALCAHVSQMRMTMTDLRRSLEVTGKHPEYLGFLDPDNYRPALEMFIRAWAAKVGARAGCAYGEAFRRETVADLFEDATGG